MKKYVLVTGMALFILNSCIKDYVGHQGGGPGNSPDISNLTFNQIGTFSNGSGDEGFAEISAFDKKTNKLFVVNPNENEVSVWDITNPSAAIKLSSIGLPGIPNSVDVYNGLLAVAVEDFNKQANGKVLTFETENQLLQNTYTTGALPDMVTFSPNGKYIITANEGEPNDDYTVDPDGSISIIEINKNEINTLYFSNFDANQIGNDFRIFGPNASISQDVEPEYVAVSHDSRYAYVVLQENNGIAVVDLKNKSITDIFGLGTKDHSLPENALDASDRDDIIGNFQNWPVSGLFLPDAITYVKLGGGEYLITANEGDARDYDGYSEEERVKDLVLDPTVFPNAGELQLDENIGRLKTTSSYGDIDGDGDYDKIYSYGGRSFTIWDTHGNIVYDSGDEIGRKTLELNASFFNADEGEADGRSDDKGAEPEAVTTLKIGGSTLLFVGLERSGGVLVYDISNPFQPQFLNWLLNTNDIAPEGLLVVDTPDSPTGKPLLIVTNEVSNTITIYEIK